MQIYIRNRVDFELVTCNEMENSVNFSKLKHKKDAVQIPMWKSSTLIVYKYLSDFLLLGAN